MSDPWGIIDEIMRLLMQRAAAMQAWSFRAIDEILEELGRGYLEPPFSIVDRGDEVVVLVDLPGARVGEALVRLGEDWVEVEAELREDVRERLYAGLLRSVRAEKYQARIRLPFRIDVNSVRREVRGSLLVIRARKLHG